MKPAQVWEPELNSPEQTLMPRRYHGFLKSQHLGGRDGEFQGQAI